MKVSQLSHLGMLCIDALQYYYRGIIPDYVFNTDHTVIIEKYGSFIAIELYKVSISLKPGDKYYDDILKMMK